MLSYREIIKRYKRIKKSRRDGKTYAAIAKIEGLTHQRVQQILGQGYPQKPKEPNPLFIGVPKWRKEGRERVRFIVRARDGFKCRDCKSRGNGKRQLDVHHINGQCGEKSRGYDKLEDIGGLVTLCHKCHYNRHDHSMKLSTTVK